jgi:beta-mannanase
MPVKSRTLLRLAVASVLLIALSGLTEAAEKQGRGKFEPPPGKAMVLVGCEWNDIYQQYRRLTGDEPAGGVFYYEFNGDTNFFWHNARENVGENGVLYIKFGLDVALDVKSTLTPFLKGEKDANIKKIGEAIKIWNHPVYVTLGTECDHWMRRGYTPAQYVKAFRRIHDIWGGMGVSNVAYVWHVCADGHNPRWTQYYPGDRYVDWVGVSFYYGTKYYPSLEPVVGAADFARRHHKSLMVSEGGPTKGQARTFEDWHGPYLSNCRRLGARIVVYNNWRELPDHNVEYENASFDRLPGPIADAWGRAMKDPAFLHASPELHELLGYDKGLVARDAPKARAAAPASVGSPVNLLGRIDPKRDAVEGDWKITDKGLTFDGDREWSRIQVPYRPPEEYDLTVVAERVRGTEILIIGLVVGSHQATVVLDGWGGGVSGLERIDGKVSQDNETTRRGWRFTNGRPTTIVCKVRRGGVSVTCEGKPIIDWAGDASRLSIVGGWKVPDDGQLFLGGWKGGAFRFRKLEVKEVSKNGLPDVGAASKPATPTAGGKFCPPKGKRLLIIGQDRDSMTAYVRDTGQVPGGFMSYNHLNAFGGQMGIKPHYIDGLHDFNIVREHPNTVLQVGLVFKGMEKEIAQGVHDDRIDRLADWFREANVPVYLRVGPEFDLPADNGFGWPTYEPEPYKLAFRHVVDRFRLKGAGKNVAFVWHSAAWKGVEKVWASYPGDDYVDWFAVSLFGRENNDGAALFARYARQRGKPLMIAEATPLGGLVGTKDGVHTWESWFNPFFDYIEKNDVRVVCFIPADWESIETYRGKGWRDTRVQVVPEIKKRWLSEVGQGKYLKASEGLFETLGYRRRTRVSSRRPRHPLGVDRDLDVITVGGPQVLHGPVSVVPVVDVRVAIPEA